MDNPRKFGRRYPWRLWFSKANLSLTYGSEYTMTTNSMAVLVRRAAARLGKVVHIRVGEGRIDVTVENPS